MLPCGADCLNCPYEDCIYDEAEIKRPRQITAPRRSAPKNIPKKAKSSADHDEVGLAALRRLWAQRDQARAELPKYKEERGAELAVAAALLQAARKAKNAEIQRRYRQRRKAREKEGEKDGNELPQYW